MYKPHDKGVFVLANIVQQGIYSRIFIIFPKYMDEQGGM